MERQYKDSGLMWIGKIPETWKVDRFKNKFKTGKGLNITKGDLVPEGIPVVSYGQIHSKQNTGTHLDDFLIRYIPSKLAEEGVSSKVSVGDFIFADTSEDIDGCGNAVYVDKEIGLYAGYHSVIAFAKHPEESKYYAYLFLTECWRSQIRMRVTGIKVFSISQAILNETTIILPPLAEQQRIADFLDKKCGEIDALIALQEQMIEKLMDYKQSVITEAVTKGLNPDAQLVPSGIDWIGDVPKGWIIAQTRRIVRNHLQGYYDPNGYVTSGYRLLRITDLLSNGNLSLDNAPFVKETPNIKDFILKPGDFCFARTGGAGNFGYVSEEIEPAVFASYLIRFRFSGQNNNFLRYYFLSYSFISEVNSLIHGGVNKNIHAENIKDTHLPLPPLSEQQSIAHYLDTKCGEIDTLIATKRQKIETLKEYKKSVIYEAVTGKTIIQ